MHNINDQYMDEVDSREDSNQILHEKRDKDEVVESSSRSKDDTLAPSLGMVFKTADEAYNFYNRYAYFKGFGIAKSHTRMREGAKHELTISCDKGGKPRSAEDHTRKRPRISGKTNCQAKIIVRYHHDGLLHLEYLVLEHNHQCMTDKVRLFRSHRKLSSSAKTHSNGNNQVKEPSRHSLQSVFEGGSSEDSTYANRHCRNYFDKLHLGKVGEGDAQAIMDYFCRMRQENPLFFDVVNLDDGGRMKNVFWADARSRTSYKYFNDVVLFDSTYLTKNFVMPFVFFVGVNHYGSSILLGAALLSDERTETFVWLFKMWLTCMDGNAPKAMITDKCKAIEYAVKVVFPNSSHRFCIWHILNKVPEMLQGYARYQEIKDRLYDVVYNSWRVSEFEERWKEMIHVFELDKNGWLKSLYEDRKKWVPVFVKNTFWAGMSNIHESESINSYFDKSVTSQVFLRFFVMAYEKDLKEKYEQEILEDFDVDDKQPPLISRGRLEEHLSSIYTLNMFRTFQLEIQKGLDCRISLVRKDGSVSIFEVKETVRDRTFAYEVLFNEEKLEVQCICDLFEFKGILCAHALVVLKEKEIKTVPARYICYRWRKDFKHKCRVCPHFTPVVPKKPINRYDKLCGQILQILPSMVEIGALSSSSYGFTINLLNEAVLNINEYDRRCREEKGNQGASYDQRGIAHSEDVGSNKDTDDGPSTPVVLEIEHA